jgi:hypothetical protein
MITAIYICEPTTLNITTNESGLELCGMGAAAPVPVRNSDGLRVGRGIYKIVSTTDVEVIGTPDPLLVKKYNPKSGTGPEQLLSEVAEHFADITLLQMQDFFAVADLRDYPNP